MIKIRDGGVRDIGSWVLALINRHKREAVGVPGKVINAGRRHGEVKEVVLREE
jgi:hypothetical protein